jgi:NAD(P)-dependent dehydrogenase (short-subunit alcohol dehydrogenase family)
MSGRFDGRTVLVTGGGRGIGQATALAFARAGANVLVLGRTVSDLEATVARIESEGGRAWHARCDVRDELEVDRTVAEAVDRAGRIHVLVNNAGIDDDTPFLEVDRDRWRAIIETNLTGPFLIVAVGRPSHGDERWRRHPAQRLDRRLRRRRAVRGVQRVEGRPARAEPHHGTRARRAGHPLELRQPRVHAHRDDREGRRPRAHGLPQRLPSRVFR